MAIQGRLPIQQKVYDGGAFGPVKPATTAAPAKVETPKTPAAPAEAKMPTRASGNADIAGSTFDSGLPHGVVPGSRDDAGTNTNHGPSYTNNNDFSHSAPVGHGFGLPPEGSETMGATLFASRVPNDHIPHLPGRNPGATPPPSHPGTPTQPAGPGFQMPHAEPPSPATLRKRDSFGAMSLADSLPPAHMGSPRPPSAEMSWPSTAAASRLSVASTASTASTFSMASTFSASPSVSTVSTGTTPSSPASTYSRPSSLDKEDRYGLVDLAGSLPPAHLDAPKQGGILGRFMKFFGLG